MPQQPLNIPVIQKPTPIVLDELLVESTDSNKALYDRMLEKGHYHPDQQRYAGYRFLKQEPTQYGQVRYYWANDFTSQDSYNAIKTQAAQTNTFPTFIRSYRVLRAEYLVSVPLTKGLAFTGIASAAVTNGGTGYTEDFAVTFTGGAGSGAAGIAIVDKGAGTVLRVELNNVGTGYTSAPVVGFASGSGTSAAATAVIQPASCVLTSEVHGKLPDDDPYTSLYDRVTRTWDTLPGPTINSTRIDFDGAVVNIATTKKLISAINSGELIIGGVTWQKTTLKEADSTLWAYEMVETRDVPGFVIPLPTEEREGGNVVTSSVQLVLIGNVVSNEAIVSTNWVRSFGKPFPESHLVALQITESRPSTGYVASPTTKEREAGDVVTITRQLVPVSDLVSQEEIDGSGNWVLLFGQSNEGSHLVVWQMMESRPAAGNIGISYEDREAGDVVTVTQQLLPVGSLTTGELIDGSANWIRSFSKAHPQSVLVAWQFTESRAVPGNQYLYDELREGGNVVSISRRLIDRTLGMNAELYTGIWTRYFTRSYEESSLVVWQISDDRAVGQGSIVTKEWDSDGALVTVTKTLLGLPISTSDSITTGVWTRITVDPMPDSSVVAWQAVRVRAIPGPTLVTWETDPETFDRIKVQKTIIDASTVGNPPSGIATANQDTTYTAINDIVTLKTVRTLNSGPTGRTEYKVAEYSFPRRLYAITGSGITDNNGNVYIKLNSTAKAAQRPKCIFKIVVTYPSSAPTITPSDYVNFILQEIIYSGLFFNVNQGDVLNDAISLSYSTGTSNPLWPSLTESVSFSASSPISASGYDALRDSFILVSLNFSPWKFNTYRLEKVYVLVPHE